MDETILAEAKAQYAELKDARAGSVLEIAALQDRRNDKSLIQHNIARYSETIHACERWLADHGIQVEYDPKGKLILASFDEERRKADLSPLARRMVNSLHDFFASLLAGSGGTTLNMTGINSLINDPFSDYPLEPIEVVVAAVEELIAARFLTCLEGEGIHMVVEIVPRDVEMITR